MLSFSPDICMMIEFVCNMQHTFFSWSFISPIFPTLPVDFHVVINDVYTNMLLNLRV